ncbi:hypothetical protein XU18_3278 [Perkinsela sp. CCAP 1560/4]|nr:hypothetical protein XU18_3278 [Perkinsela sp. CCAP 1560/4]|eukprot:KNH05756.1 hypothetical protein XU18_3278 [Perkinsela sp. CCAP 1560/4]
MIRISKYHLVIFQLSRVLRYPEANILNTGTLPPANAVDEKKVNPEEVKDYHAKLESTARLQQNQLGSNDDSIVKKDERRNAFLGSSEELSRTIREYKSHENQKIVASLMETKSADVVYYRNHPHPWELLVKPRRHRVADMIGVLMSEHRIEMEHIIWKICDLCGLDFYFVLVPTVGNVKPRVFAESLFTQWEVGTPIQQFVHGIMSENGEDKKSTSASSKSNDTMGIWKPRKRSLARGGNGVLLLLTQQEAMIELVTSYAIAKYFNERMINLVVKEILQPLLVSGKDPSYAILQVIYAIARHSDEFKYKWRPYFYPIITLQHKNEILFLQHTMYYGVYRKTPILTLTFLFILFTLWMLHKIRDLRCDKCGTMMKRLVLPKSYYDAIEKLPELDELPKREERRKQFLQNLFSIYGDALTEGQKLEMEHECAEYRVFYCAKCEVKKTRLIYRQYHNYSNCIPCEKCNYHTVTEKKELLRLPTKTEDGVKQFDYRCKNCDWEKKIYLPLFHPLELHPKQWYDVLLQRSANPNAKSDVKMF